MALQRHFKWVDSVFHEDNCLFEVFQLSDFKKVLKLLTGVDHVGVGMDYVLSKVASQEASAVFQFFVEHRKICDLHASMLCWPARLQRTQSVLGKMGLNEMQAFYAFLRNGSDSVELDFMFRLLPQLLNLSAQSFSEMIRSARNNEKDFFLVLRILQQYPDDLAVIDHYKCIVNAFKLQKNQIQAICSQLIFVGQYAGREGRLNQLQARQSIVNAWEAGQNPNVKIFLIQFNKAMETAIKDEQSQVSREQFNDTAAFQDEVKRHT